MRANGPKTWGYTLVLVGFILAVGGHLGARFSGAQGEAIAEARWRDVDREIDEIWIKHWTRLKTNLLSLGELGLRTVEETATGPRFDVPDELETMMTKAVEETADELRSTFVGLTFIVKANIRPLGEPAGMTIQPLPIFMHAQESGDLPPEAVDSPSQFGLRLDSGRSQLELHFGPSKELDRQGQFRERYIFGKYFPETPIKYLDVAGNEMAGGLIGRTAFYIYSRREYVSPALYNTLAVLLTRLGQFGILLLLIAPPVWVYLDAYESDMMWIRYGQEVEFETEAYPGEVFAGTISFIDPVLNAKTRTVKLRVDVENPDGKLKPEMFVRAVVRAKVAQGGRVMDEAMAGKWICPMHPDVVKDGAGSCDICGMDLVTTESLGYVKVDAPKEAPLIIPASAPLITGKRAVVYVQLRDKEKPTYEGREVVLGPRAGDYYIVKSGLDEGEIVVTKGNFKIDSALQIRAKPSMMNPKPEKAPMRHHSH